MTVLVANTLITNTFDYWRNRTNELATAMSNSAVTVNSNTATGNAAITGTMTANLFSGNVAAPIVTASNVVANIVSSNIVNGNTANLISINSNTIVVNSYVTVGSVSVNTLSITVGNVSVNTNYVSVGNATVNVQLTSPSLAQISNGQYFLSSNSTWSLITVPASPVTTNTFVTSGSSSQIIDFYPMATYKTVEYLINVSDNNANNHYASKIITTHDGVNGYSTEYAQITTNTSVGVFSVDANTTCVRLNFMPSLIATTVKFARTTV